MAWIRRASSSAKVTVPRQSCICILSDEHLMAARYSFSGAHNLWGYLKIPAWCSRLFQNTSGRATLPVPAPSRRATPSQKDALCYGTPMLREGLGMSTGDTQPTHALQKLLPVSEVRNRVLLASVPFPKTRVTPVSDGGQLRQAWPSVGKVLVSRLDLVMPRLPFQWAFLGSLWFSTI